MVTNGEGGKQRIDHLDKYLTAPHWEFYESPEGNKDMKLMSMASLLHSLGVCKGKEHLFANATALATQTEPLNADRLLLDTRRLKGFYSKLGLSPHAGPPNYPTNPWELQENYPNIFDSLYKEHKPVPTKWSDHYRAMLFSVAPCRNTKTGCSLLPNTMHNWLCSKMCWAYQAHWLALAAATSATS